jgi:hydrogenase expression/formation protein HypC
MCLAIPGRITKKKQGHKALVEVGGLEREINLDLLPDAVEGDYVLIHTGFAIQKVDEAEAEETLSLLKQMREAVEVR